MKATLIANAFLLAFLIALPSLREFHTQEIQPRIHHYLQELK